MITELPRHQSLRALPRRHRAALAHAALDAHGRHGDPRPAARRGGRAHRPRQRRDALASPATPWCSPRDWIPDHELAVMGGLEIDPGTRGPRVDAALRTSRPGVFAAGNLLHGAETADVAALSGRHAAAGAAASVSGAPGRGDASRSGASRRSWISPNAVAPGAGTPPRDRFAPALAGVRAASSRGGRPGRPQPLGRPPAEARARALRGLARTLDGGG